MKYLLCALALFLSLNMKAQELPKKSKIFVRVYNDKGEKIAKGKVLNITDDEIKLKKGSNSVTVSLTEISYIKTKRTKGHNLLIGGVAGAAIPIIASSGGDSSGWETIAVVILTPVTAVLGTGIGYLTTIFKKSQHYAIQGDPVKWKGFKETMYAPQ